MKCPQCGNDVVQGAAYCHACGGSLVRKAPSPSAAPAAPAAASPAKQRVASAGSGSDDHEQVLWVGKFSKLAMIGEWLGAAVATLVTLIVAGVAGFSGTAWGVTLAILAALWIGLVLRLLYLQLSIKYSLTNQRFIHERGLLWRQTDRIETIDIDDVSVQQGPVERMLGIGTVRVVSSDQTTPQFSIVGIEDVKQVATMIDDARRAERRKRGLYVESV